MFQSKFIFNLKSLIFVSEKTKIDRTKNLLKLGPPIIASRNFESNNFALIAISAVPRLDAISATPVATQRSKDAKFTYFRHRDVSCRDASRHRTKQLVFLQLAIQGGAIPI